MTLRVGSAALTALAMVAGAQAEVVRLDPILVTGTRQALPLAEIGARVFEIDEKSIEAQPARDVYDLLESLPNTQVRRYGGIGGEASISMYGHSANPTAPTKTLVAIDGVPLNSGLDPFTSLNMFPLPWLNRVEVIQGPASAAFGNNAMTGVVNLIPKRATDTAEGTLSLSGGRFSTLTADGYVGTGAAGRYSAGFAFNYLESNGHIQPLGMTDYSDSRLGSLALNGRYEFGATSLSGAFVYYDFERNNPNATLTGALSNSFEDGNRLHAHAKVQHVVTDGIDVEAALWTNRSENEGFSRPQWVGSVPIAVTNPFEEKGSTVGGLVKLNWETDKNLLTVGYEYQDTELTDRLAGTSQSGTLQGVFALNRFLAFDRQLALNLGYRFDDSSAYSDRSSSPSASFVWAPHGSRFAWRGQIGRSFKAPTLSELYQVGRVIGNPDLKAQTFLLKELGVDFRPSSTALLSLTVFDATLKDPIYWRPREGLPPGVIGQFTNVSDESEIRGASLGSQWAIGPDWILRASYDYLDPGQATFATARHTVKVTPTFERGPWTAFASARYQADRYWDDNKQSPAPDYFVFDAQVSRRIDRFELFASVENLFNEDYATGANVSVAAGQRSWVGLDRPKQLWMLGLRGYF